MPRREERQANGELYVEKMARFMSRNAFGYGHFLTRGLAMEAIKCAAAADAAFCAVAAAALACRNWLKRPEEAASDP